ncbi:MAG TPA: purine-nucleoside phosphorylase [Fimbriiglobus sp.]|jgi:purine-nucleoside phosphorylase
MSFAEFRAAADGIRPSAAVILGSGLAGATTHYRPDALASFADVPGLAPSGVPGHAGKVSVGYWSGVPVLVFHGRLHFYEGHSWETITGTVRLASELGVKRIVLTNAAGGIHPDLNPGGVMLIRGHLKWFPFPCEGKGLDAKGEFAIATPYSTQMVESLIDAESALCRSLHSGIYAALTGPCYETPAEIRALKAMGADAVGMSTAMEAEAAAECGLEVLGISCITNKAAGLSKGALNHTEVQVNGARTAKRVGEMIDAVLNSGVVVPRITESSFIGCVGEADFHDGSILMVEQNDELVRVRVRGASGKVYVVGFNNPSGVRANCPENMLLYSLTEMSCPPPMRRFVFANWDDQSQAYLEIEAKSFTVHAE